MKHFLYVMPKYILLAFSSLVVWMLIFKTKCFSYGSMTHFSRQSLVFYTHRLFFQRIQRKCFLNSGEGFYPIFDWCLHKLDFKKTCPEFLVISILKYAKWMFSINLAWKSGRNFCLLFILILEKLTRISAYMSDM